MHILGRSTAARTDSLNLLHNIHSLKNLSEHNMASIEPLGLDLSVSI